MTRPLEASASAAADPSRESEIRVGVADMAVSTSGKPLVTSSLGSCVAVCISDTAGNGGLVHAMLPEAPANPDTPAKYVDSGIKTLVVTLRDRTDGDTPLTGKIAGGSYMIEFTQGEPVNDRNVAQAWETTLEMGIDLVADDTGGESPRSVTFDPVSGSLAIRQGSNTRRI